MSEGLPRIPAATALALVTTTPAPPVTDEGKLTDFLLDDGMVVVVIPDHLRRSSPIWCGGRSATLRPRGNSNV